MHLSELRTEQKCAVSFMKECSIRKLFRVIFSTSIIYTYLMGISAQSTILKGLLVYVVVVILQDSRQYRYEMGLSGYKR